MKIKSLAINAIGKVKQLRNREYIANSDGLVTGIIRYYIKEYEIFYVKVRNIKISIPCKPDFEVDTTIWPATLYSKPENDKHPRWTARANKIKDPTKTAHWRYWSKVRPGVSVRGLIINNWFIIQKINEPESIKDSTENKQ